MSIVIGLQMRSLRKLYYCGENDDAYDILTRMTAQRLPAITINLISFPFCKINWFNRPVES